MPRKTKIIKLKEVPKSIITATSKPSQLTYLAKEMKKIIQSIENSLEDQNPSSSCIP